MSPIRRIGIVGGGAWGTALANAAALSGNGVVLWMRDAQNAAAAELSRVNERHLPGVRLLDSVGVTHRSRNLSGSDLILLAVPTQSIRPALAALDEVLPRATPFVLCAKGVERGTGLFPTGIVRAVRPDQPVAILSGPSFAADVARGLPTAIALAAEEADLAGRIGRVLSGPTLRIYHGTDIRGVEIGGAAKNVLAIAVGIVEGRGLGESARAALTARGFAELLRFAAASGGRPETLMGLSGLGDVVLSCASPRSRNFALGVRIGRGLPPAEGGQPLAEGAFTAGALAALAEAAGIEMPVCAAVERVLSGHQSVADAVDGLMSRPLRPE